MTVKLLALGALFAAAAAQATGSHTPPPSPSPAQRQEQGQAQHQGQSQGQAQQQSASSASSAVAGASATNNGNSQSVLFTSPASTTVTTRVSGTTTLRNVPSVNAPALVSSNDTCMGSVSGSFNVAGFGGGLGSTYKDANCVNLKNARELWNMGFRAAALARMCMDAENRQALEVTGFECLTGQPPEATSSTGATKRLGE